MSKFYFTYGTSRQFPYQGGWTEVVAANERAACAAFRAYHPDQTEGILNCSDVYPESAFKATKMYTEGNFGYRCHERIVLMRDCSVAWERSVVPELVRERSVAPVVAIVRSNDLKGEQHD